MAAEAQATAEEAIESATASVPVADPEPAPAPPRRTVFHEPGRAATGYALLLADGSRIALGDLQSGAVGLGKDPTRAQVVVDHPTVSGLHARLSLQASELVVEDAGSSNGTYVDGQDIRGRGPVVVAAGQQLQLGLLKTVVEAS